MKTDAVAFPYKVNIAQTMVYGPLFIAGVCALGATSRGIVELYYVGAAALPFTLFHLPMLNTKRPPILAEARGLFVDGIGLIPWSAIRAATYRERLLRALRIGQIVIALTGTIDTVLTRRDTPPFWRRLQTKVWRMEGRDLILDLRSIDGDAMKVYETLERFRRG